MPKSSFYITTAIDYTNGAPHIGHAYEKVMTDVIARYQRFAGREVYFLTGVDQHGQKVQQTAEKEGIHPGTYVKKITKKFKRLCELLNVSNDGWAETTAELHKEVVRKILQSLHDEGQIYQKKLKGFYSVRQEQFLTDKERDEETGEFGPEWGEVEEREEENWYFKLSEHVDWLKAHVGNTPDFVTPAFRMTEVLNAVENTRDLDLCISRPKERLRWGIELPFDPDAVTYVWFDALINYISFAGYRADENSEGLPDFESLWPADAHVIGKDIMVPAHAIYWPIMLHAMGMKDEEIPRLLVHGWWNIVKETGETEKMSKSLGNIVDPVELIAKFGVDAVRFYLASDISTGKDANFNLERLIQRHNVDLANDLGNLANRTLNMTKRYVGGILEPGDYDDDVNKSLRELHEVTLGAYKVAMDGYDIHHAIDAVWKLVTHCNQYADATAPWQLAKEEASAARLASVLYHLTEAIAQVSLLVAPIVPESAAKLQSQLGLTEAQSATTFGDLRWGLLPTGHQTGKGKPIFPKLELELETDAEAE